MKRKILLLAAVLSNIIAIHAANYLTVSDVTIPQGGTGNISVALTNDKDYTAFQIKITLPAGLNYVSVNKGARMAEDHSLSGKGSTGMITCLSTANTPFTGNSGELFTITVSVDNDVSVGTSLDVSLTEISFSTSSGEEPLEDVEFKVTVGEPSDGRTVLDETSTTLPEDAAGVDVRVMRTIKANEWSTIVLPFAMDNTQLKAAFGDDVQLADFTSWESEEDEYGDIININIGFTDVTEIEANHPYIIKVSDAISEFTVDDVDIEVEDEPTVQVGKKKSERGYFIGTYVAQTIVPEDNLFLNSSMFWYSAGLTKMKAFRGYFELADVLSEQEVSSAKVLLHVGDIATVIDGTEMNIQGKVQGVYSIQGTFLGKEVDTNQLPDGLYIIDGKKVSVKN